jgi:hypothetical protein
LMETDILSGDKFYKSALKKDPTDAGDAKFLWCLVGIGRRWWIATWKRVTCESSRW